MGRRTRTMIAIAIWTGPVLLGMAFAMWIIISPSLNARRDGPVGESTRDDQHRLQGNWEGIHVERDGKVVYEGTAASQARVRFVRNRVVFEDRDARLEGTFTVDQSRMPKTFDMTVAEGGDFATYPAGIYQLNGGTLRLCFAFPARERPSTFETTPGSGRTLFIYRRAEAPDHEPQDARGLGRNIPPSSIENRALMVAGSL
jgi:uncharacterized protein (TIGR03067 family)